MTAFVAFLFGVLAGGGAATFWARAEKEDLALRAYAAEQRAARVTALVLYIADEGLRCPTGVDASEWASMVEVSMVHEETRRLEEPR